MPPHTTIVVLCLATLIALAAATISGAANLRIDKCSSATCENVICGFSAPIRCTEDDGSVACFHSPDNAFGQCCDAKSCAASKCSASCAWECPCTQGSYFCEAGESDGGCFDNPPVNNTMCSRCCACGAPNPSPPPPPSPPSPGNFTCGTCPTSYCETEFRCKASAPYVCLSGRSKLGCAPSAHFWPTHEAFCGSCCDDRTCDNRFKCKPCSQDQCFAPQCPSTAPYTCTRGISQGGCSASPDHWPDSSTCTDCCYC